MVSFIIPILSLLLTSFACNIFSEKDEWIPDEIAYTANTMHVSSIKEHVPGTYVAQYHCQLLPFRGPLLASPTRPLPSVNLKLTILIKDVPNANGRIGNLLHVDLPGIWTVLQLKEHLFPILYHMVCREFGAFEAMISVDNMDDDALLNEDVKNVVVKYKVLPVRASKVPKESVLNYFVPIAFLPSIKATLSIQLIDHSFNTLICLDDAIFEFPTYFTTDMVVACMVDFVRLKANDLNEFNKEWRQFVEVIDGAVGQLYLNGQEVWHDRLFSSIAHGEMKVAIQLAQLKISK